MKGRDCLDCEVLQEKMNTFLKETPLNKVDELAIDSIFDQPLVGIADATDDLFMELKQTSVVGPNHMLPSEWLENAKSVISYFLPFSEKIRETNRKAGYPSLEWVYGRIEGELVNNALRNYIVDEVEKNGGKSIAPALSSSYSVKDKRSNWSERHVAYIAGLGTFGLSRSLITKVGCSGRYGSVITSIKIEHTPRTYERFSQYCSTCGTCIKRCPSKAITKEGKDILTCANYSDNIIKPIFHPRYGCGKCQTIVPCESKLPS